jgi:hypothetical protein
MNYYLYGLQRSGTNVIKTFLMQTYNIRFNNTGDRGEIGHKHFRIYDDKTKIPTCIQQQYGNNIIINKNDDLIKLLKEDVNNVKIVVVIKDIFSWLISIEKWGEKCKWSPFIKDEFLNEYKLYTEKWYQLSKENPNICIIHYDEYINFIKNKNTDFITKLNYFFNKNITISDIKEIKKVDCSTTFTNDSIDYYYYKRYMDNYTTNEIKTINTFLEK